MKIEFYKYQGAGNDFILLDNRNNKYNDLTTQHVKHLCDRHFGIGADGLMLLNEKKGYDFEMVYYNADGMESSMCGNGGRCIVRFAYDLGIVLTEYKFLATDGQHKASFDERNWIQLQMRDVHEIDKRYNDFIVDTGSPHYIKFVTNVMDRDVFTEGKKIRNSHDFEEEGINVNFVEQDDDWITVRTYERGVEDETLSCGTGVTASALVSAHNDLGFNRVEVRTKGGHLAVEFDKIGEDHFKHIYLCGPATFVFKGETEIKVNTVATR